MAELKPCPFCGNKNISVVVNNAEYSLGLIDETDVSFKVICSTTSCGCGASSGWCETEQEAIEAWDRGGLTMAEYIEREVVRCKNCIHNDVCFHREMINDIDEWLDEFGCGYFKPAADMVEVRHGVWILKDNKGNGVCSVCNRQDGIDPLATHCRYCGAKIDGKGEGE